LNNVHDVLLFVGLCRVVNTPLGGLKKTAPSTSNVGMEEGESRGGNDFSCWVFEKIRAVLLVY